MDDPSDIRNWQRRPDGITTSGKLEAGDPARLAAAGVRHVINLTTGDHAEDLADEASLMEEAGLEYTHIPVPFDAPTPDHVKALSDVIETSDGPVHVHCIMNYRVTAFLYLIDRANGVSEDQARSRLTEIWDPFATDDPRARPWRDLLQG